MDDRAKAYFYKRSQSKAAQPLSIEKLVCKDCQFRGEGLPVGHCIIFRKGYEFKPNEILLGGDCKYYEKE